METAHRFTRCPVYLHPAAASNPGTIARIQRRTGLLVIVGSGHKAATLRPFPADLGPFGGAA